MFEMTRTALSKVGLCENPDDENQLEDQTEVDNTLPEIIVQELTEVPKQVGLIAAFVKDPQQDLEALTPLLGVLKSVETKMTFTCPVCHDETHHNLQELDLDDDCVCLSCQHEGIVGDFYDGESEHSFVVTTTRHITDDEIGMLLHGDSDANRHRRDRERTQIKVYFAMLNGHQPPAPSGVIPCAPEILYQHHCDIACQARNCRCFGNYTGSLLGMLKPMPVEEVVDDEEGCDDDFDTEGD